MLQLVETENVRGVITMNEEYETKYLCNSAEVSLKCSCWNKYGCDEIRKGKPCWKTQKYSLQLDWATLLMGCGSSVVGLSTGWVFDVKQIFGNDFAHHGNSCSWNKKHWPALITIKRTKIFKFNFCLFVSLLFLKCLVNDWNSLNAKNWIYIYYRLHLGISQG